MTPPIGVNGDNFRDPTTAWQGPDGTWKVVIGSYSNKQGMAIIYQSKDFVNWTMHPKPLYSTSKTDMWECPDFFPVSINNTNGVETSVTNPSVRHVMKSDFTGTSSDLRIDYGKFYASKTFFDSKKNRRILWAWVNESNSSEDDIHKGWSGLQAIPRKIWIDRSGKQLVQWPVEELNNLRDNQVYVYGKHLKSGSVFEVSGITASKVDIETMFELPELEEAEFMDTSLVDPQLICDRKDSFVTGKYGPFGLLALATKDLKE
ncbi:beta-fructofuranosidase, insoluble isoenzyme CWINV6-like [Hibiscus syriacus]|uniref:beta-fructofuranosidase, insoluble isoenzyme CWINV6-like n=1 Tax=Hibiscus syriacus TaxID=106335 RepID=UPI00192451CE|nr:beta-fructofuranosidase, insoluble isoenzyme CWINV6-like [Hibiscus syriacus]